MPLRSLALSFAVLCCTVAAACATSAAPSLQIIELGTELTLSPLGKARLEDSQLQVQFISIAEDSRCPKDVTCVWAGEVKVRLDIAVGQRPAVRHEVLERESVTVDGYQLEVVRVLPYPATSAKIPSSEYRVTLLVSCDRCSRR